MECFCHKIWCITVLLIFLRKASSYMKASQCAGQLFSLTCGNDNYVIHILYEIYSYRQDPMGQCVYNSSLCSGAEFINPYSTGYCNGYSQCSFTVPMEHHLTACNKTATEVTVLYNCFARNQMIDICKPFSSRNEQLVYFKSPDYPSQLLQPTKCLCNITGQNVTAEVYEHQKSKNSSVVFMFVTNKMTIHVNAVEIRNRILFSEMNSIQLIVDNRQYQALFKLWMKVTGQEMNINCQSQPVEIKPSSTTHNATTDFISNLPTHQIQSSIIDLSELIKISTTVFTSIIIHKSSNQDTLSLSTNQNRNLTLHSTQISFKTSSSLHPITTTAIKSTTSSQLLTENFSTVIISTTSSHLLTPSSSIDIYQNNRTTEKQLTSNTDLEPIIIIASVVGIIFIISIILGIFIYQRKHKNEDVSYSTDGSDGEIYHAYRF